MRRRDFIAGLSGAAAWPIAARAQQTATQQQTGLPRVGILLPFAPEDVFGQRILEALRQGLQQHGWTQEIGRAHV